MKRCILGRCRHGSFGLALAAGLLLAGAAAADPIEDLRQALPIDDKANPTEAMLQFRRTNLKQKIDALTTIGQLRRALVLDEWRDDPSRSADKEIILIDAKMRKEVGERLTSILDREAKSPDPLSKLAVANIIAEIGPSVRALTPDDKSGFARSLFPVVQRLATDKTDVGVRQEALRALGNINPKAKEAAKILKNAFADPAPGARRAAADALGQLVRVVAVLQRTSRATTGIEASRTDVLDTAAEVIQVSPEGLVDPDPQVRGLCADAIQSAVQALLDSRRDTRRDFERPGGPVTAPSRFPPQGRPLSPLEKAEVEAAYRDKELDIAELRPVLAGVREVAPLLKSLLAGSDPHDHLIAMETLKSLAMGRQQLRQRVLSLPVYPEIAKDPLNLLEGVDPLESFLRSNLNDVAPLTRAADPRVRLAAVTFLYLIEDRALPLASQLTMSLADSERAIRWMSARALANLPPDKISDAVPYLAKLLGDADVAVRKQAAETLQGMGPLAGPARGALAKAITHGDSEGRIAALDALKVLAPEDLQAALPQFVEVLGQRDTDAKVLVATAETLGQMGSAAAPALPVLRRLIGHDAADVRSAASEAILAINAAGKR